MNNNSVLFLDIGGVLLSDGWGRTSRESAAKQFGIDFEKMERLHFYHFNLFETGKITLDGYLDFVVFNHPRNFTREAFKDFIFSQSSELPEMLPWIKQWKRNNRGFKVISLNNEGRELNDYRIRKFSLHECFDAFISSGDVGMLKPDPGIYQLALAIVKAAPQDCFYFDDNLPLVEAAKRFGIQSFHHQAFESTREIIEGMV